MAKKDMKTLLAAVPKPYGAISKELLAAPDEIKAVASIIPAETIVTLPKDEDTLVNDCSGLKSQTLLERLPDANILHLACHGIQDASNPLKSGFVMSDGMLSIEQLMPVTTPHAFLAFLSACETAKGDKASTASAHPRRRFCLC
jgi:CHAT domain-containing protein